MALRDVREFYRRPQIDTQRMIRLGLLAAILVLGLTFILSVHLIPSRYEVHEGDVSSQNIRALKRVQYLSAIETKAERERAAAGVQELFVFDAGVASQQRNKLATALQGVSAARSNGTLAADAKKAAIRRALEFDLSDDRMNQILQMDEPAWQLLVTNTPKVLYEMLSERVTTERLRDMRPELNARLVALPNEQDRALAVDLAHFSAKANYAPNPTETARLRKEAQDAVAPIGMTVEKGEIILREGDVVRAIDLEKLEALGLRNPALDWQSIGASALLSLLVVSLLVGYIWLLEPALLAHDRRLTLLVLVVLAAVLAAKVVLPGRPYWAYVFPISAVAMLLATLLDAQLALLVTALLACLVAVIANGSLEVAVIGMVAGVLGSLGVRRSDRLHSYFVAGGLVSVGTFAVILAFRLLSKDEDWASLALMGGLSVVNGLLAASLTVGTFSLLGRLFGITTSMQLLELSDPTQPLLRRLVNEAPGTYHHSIMVGNLAERAAERIGADPLLVRVGAYYHDVGKLARPYFFIENQLDGRNVHDTLDPQTSARIVAAHVRDGLELAEKYNLPARVREFITGHHGTRMVSFFYNQATKEGKNEVDASQYIYPGPKPLSKEVGIVMLADSVEAVVRSMKDHSPDKVAEAVRRVVDERVAEGQLDDCDLTIRELEEIKKAFLAILMGMYHPRIEYPAATPDPREEAGQAVDTAAEPAPWQLPQGAATRVELPPETGDGSG